MSQALPVRSDDDDRPSHRRWGSRPIADGGPSPSADKGKMDTGDDNDAT